MSDLMQIGLDRKDQIRFEKAARGIPEKVFKRHVGKNANKAMTPVSRAAKKMAPKDEGAYRKSIGKKKKTYSKTKVVWVGVGPRRGMKNANLGHLIEYGHRIVSGGTTERVSGKRAGRVDKARNAARTGKGRVVGFVIAIPHLRNAIKNNKNNVYSIYRRGLRTGIMAEAAKA